MNYEVLEGAEEFFYEGNHVGVLVIHGFTGSTQSMHYLGERFAEAGFTVFGPRLTGHGTAPEDMERASYEDWMKDVEKGLSKLRFKSVNIWRKTSIHKMSKSVYYLICGQLPKKMKSKQLRAV